MNVTGKEWKEMTWCKFDHEWKFSCIRYFICDKGLKSHLFLSLNIPKGSTYSTNKSEANWKSLVACIPSHTRSGRGTIPVLWLIRQWWRLWSELATEWFQISQRTPAPFIATKTYLEVVTGNLPNLKIVGWSEETVEIKSYMFKMKNPAAGQMCHGGARKEKERQSDANNSKKIDDNNSNDNSDA